MSWKKVIDGLREAIAFARGEPTGTRVTVVDAEVLTIDKLNECLKLLEEFRPCDFIVSAFHQGDPVQTDKVTILSVDGEANTMPA